TTSQLSELKIYIGASDGGVFYSGNGGQTFADISIGIRTNITALAVDPSDGSTVYAAVYASGVLNRPPIPVSLDRLEIQAKKLLVHGSGLDQAALVYAHDVAQKTAAEQANPTSLLIAKKGGKAIAPGLTVEIRVVNPSGDASNNLSFSRP